MNGGGITFYNGNVSIVLVKGVQMHTTTATKFDALFKLVKSCRVGGIYTPSISNLNKRPKKPITTDRNQ